jgi:hypothetical protein
LNIGGVCLAPSTFPAFLALSTRVISGFNTDIEHNGVVYHVQTEDKGAPANVIMSLVYDKGTILASKRAGYDGVDEKELTERLARQHKLICGAVNSGRISELVDMTRKSSKYGARPEPDTPPSVPEMVVTTPVVPHVAQVEPSVATPTFVHLPTPPVVTSTPPPIAERVFEEVTFDDLQVIDAVEIIEDLEILPDEAVAVVSEFSGKERTSHDKLGIELLGESKFKGGERKTVNIMVCRGTDRKVVEGAQIMIKVLGSTFRPVIFHASSDVNGLARVHLQLPHFNAGRAALLVRAMSDGQEMELRRVVTPG